MSEPPRSKSHLPRTGHGPSDGRLSLLAMAGPGRDFAADAQKPFRPPITCGDGKALSTRKIHWVPALSSTILQRFHTAPRRRGSAAFPALAATARRNGLSQTAAGDIDELAISAVSDPMSTRSRCQSRPPGGNCVLRSARRGRRNRTAPPRLTPAGPRTRIPRGSSRAWSRRSGR